MHGAKQQASWMNRDRETLATDSKLARRREEEEKEFSLIARVLIQRRMYNIKGVN